MSVYFTADTHFGHSNIIRFCNRPFDDADQMDRVLIDNWNSVVGQKDTVYFLGDFSFRGKDASYYKNKLNGSIHFIRGNHDKSADKIKDKFASYTDLSTINVNKQSIVLCHYAMRVWNKSFHGAWQLYGHSHGTLPDDPHSLSIDVGVDCHNYFPISFDQVKDIMSKKDWECVG